MNAIQPSSAPAPDDLITIHDACTLVPSPKTGRQTCPGTVYRWILKGRLRAWRRGHWLVVSRAEVLALLRPVPVAIPAPIETRAERELAAQQRAAWADRTLRELGLRK